MNLNFILFVLIPCILMLITCIAFPIYRNNLMKTAGSKLVPLTKKSARLSYIASATAVVLLLLSVKIDFGRLNFIIPYCAVLGFIVTTKESTFLPVNGAYENLLIVGSIIVKYKDVVDFKSEGTSENPSNIITVTQTNRRPQQLIFNNTNEATEVLSVVKKKSLINI